ncbi:MAG: hypothetical protein COB85_08955, partial [Bacteroidetes bacterium]
FEYLCELSISVKDAEGNEMLPGGTITITLGDSTVNDVCNHPIDTSISFSVFLDTGQYTVSKVLTIDESYFQQYAEIYIENCGLPVDSFIDSVDIDCFIDCSTCLAALGEQDSFLLYGGTTEEWEEMAGICAALCDTPSSCSGYMSMMLMDVMPGGYHASIVNSKWQQPFTPYLDEYGALDTITLQNGSEYLPQNLPSLNDFLANWKDSWAKSLVEHHPEYCFYQWCKEQEEAEKEQFMMLATSSFYEALTEGWMSPLGLNDTSLIPSTIGTSQYVDPLFTSNGLGFTYIDTMIAWISNYNNTGVSLWELVAIGSGCSVCDSPCDTLPFGDTLLLNKATLDEQWTMFRSFYLSLRQKLLLRIQSEWQQNRNCFNDCYDEAFAQSITNSQTEPNEEDPNTPPDSNPTDLNNTQGSTISLTTDFVNLISPAPGTVVLTVYDSLYKSDTACFYVNTGKDGLLSISHNIAEDYTSLVHGVGLWPFAHPPDTCYCSTVLNAYDDFDDPDDLAGFTQYFDTLYNTNLTDIQLVTMLEACVGAYAGSGWSGVPATERCLFQNPYDMLQDSDAYSCDTILEIFEEECSTTCEGYALFWKPKLAACISDVNVLNNVIERMIMVCELGCDPAHPAGSSSLPQGLTTNAGDSSFHQILSGTTSCNPYTIGMPKLYAHKMYNKVSGQIDSCACDNVIAAYDAFTDKENYTGFTAQINSEYETEMSVTAVRNLLCICNETVDSNRLCGDAPLYSFQIPNELRCYGCVTCDVIEQKLQDYLSELPNDSISFYGAIPIQNYLNDKLDLNLFFTEYMSFMDSSLANCNIDSALVCNHGLFPAAPPDSSCEEEITAIAITNALILHQQYLDFLKESLIADHKKFVGDNLNETFSMYYIIYEGYYTLYYYDRAGNLQRTVPPEGVNPLKDSALLSGVGLHRENPINNTPVYPQHTMGSRYAFNSLNNQVKVITPDANISKSWYDKLGRVVVSQRANQAPTSSYNYLLYDALGRIIESGEISNSNQMSVAVASDSTSFSQWITAGTKKSQTLTHYDSTFTLIDGFIQENLRNRISTTVFYDDRFGAEFSTHYSYDIHGNVKTVVQENSMIPEPHRFKWIDYTYDLLSGNVLKVEYQKGEDDHFEHRFLYDPDNRIANVLTSTDGIEWESDAEYNYYKHGPLARKLLGDLRIQGVDYAYTAQGWLRAINGGNNNEMLDIGYDGNLSLPGNPNEFVGRDAFSYSLGYFDGDYSAINSYNDFLTNVQGSNLDTTAYGLYNGNIRYTTSSTKNKELYSSAYKYDVLNRLRSSQIFNNFDSSSTSWQNNNMLTQDYATSYTYDLNGNILGLTRNGLQDSVLEMDSLSYSYITSTNQLAYVDDAVAASNYRNDLDDQDSGNYEYDLSGNLIADRKEAIAMNWNHLGKLNRVERTTNTGAPDISFYYDAMGNRVIKELDASASSGPDSLIWYVYGADNNLMAIYSHVTSTPRTRASFGSKINSIPDWAKEDSMFMPEAEQISQGTEDWHRLFTVRLLEVPIYGSDRIGIYKPGRRLEMRKNNDSIGALDTLSYSYLRGDKRYELKNHLGNIHVVISDKRHGFDLDNDSITDYYLADVASVSDYYPFGMQMLGKGLNEYRFGFNGMENDKEIKGTGMSYDFGARIYDPRVGRWLTIDPLAQKYTFSAPYAFVLNTPLQAVDPDGRLVIFVNGYHGGFIGVIGIGQTGVLTGLGKRKYWGGLDNKFTKRMNDDNRYYSDGGTRTAWSSAQERYDAGVKEGRAMLKKIKSGEISIEVDENGIPTETIKIISHSQGDARAAGISNVMSAAGYTIEVEYRISSKQAEDIPATNADRTAQYGSDWDVIAHQSRIIGVDEHYELQDDKKTLQSGGGHRIGQYDEIFDIPEGEDGYVAPRKDAPKTKLP